MRAAAGIIEERRQLWSLQPLALTDPPTHPAARTPVDAFLLAALAEAGLSHSPEADRRTLVRRLHFVLTGLPPAPETVAAVVADPDPLAIDRLADQLIDSRAFAEHWARHWLDAVRYSDSNGFDWDEFRPEAWRYRDYVIRAFLTDKPFDRFLREQLAGDTMVPGEPQHAADQDALLATGYLRVGPWDNSSKLFNEQHKAQAAHLADLTETTAAVFIGMTFSCCRCHDHKTEPLTQEDHYRLRACFADVTFADSRPLDLAVVQEEIRRHNAPHDAAITDADKTIAALEKQKQPDKATAARLDDARRRRDAARAARRSFTVGLVAGSAADAPAIHVLAGGDADQPRDTVAPGIPAVFPPAPIDPAGRRRALADWLTSPQHPLTARVAVNRLWQHVFGTGLVTTTHDFGHSGARPSHPALLDWLARDFMAHGWSSKHTIRLLVRSAAFRQSSLDTAGTHAAAVAKDRDHRLLWRFPPRRLSAEMLRDSLLAVAGTLTPSTGGPPVWPELPAEILQANPAFLDDNAEKTKGWYPSPPERRHVRSIYLVQKRSVRLPFMETFDLPDNFSPCDRRQQSIVAPQALTLLNSQEATDAARAFAARIARESEPDPASRIRRAWQLALQRDPDDAESASATRLLASRRLDDLARVLLNLNEFIWID